MPKTNGLTLKQEAFCQNYFLSGNAVASYIAAGYSSRGDAARVEACKLLAKPNIQARIQELQAEKAIFYADTCDRLVKDLSKMASVNPLDALVYIPDENGEGGQYQLRSPDDMSEEAKASISEIRFNRFGVAVKFHDKTAAQDRLARILGLYGGINDGIAILRKYGLHLMVEDGKWKLLDDQQHTTIEADAEQLEGTAEDTEGETRGEFTDRF